MFSKRSTKKSVNVSLLFLTVFAFWGLAIVSADIANAYEVFVGIQSGGGYGSEGGGAVYKYEGGTTWTNISAGTEIGQAVMDLEIFDGALYAATQTQSGYGGYYGNGQVWRYDGGISWTQVGQMDTSAMDLLVYRDELYVVTTDNQAAYRTGRGKIYKYDSSSNSWTLMGTDSYTSHSTGFYVAIVSDVSGTDEIIIGDLNTDKFSTYSTEDGLVFREDHYGSCVWDFAEYEGDVYSGHWLGPIYKTTDGRNWNLATSEYPRHFWALEAFQGNLYVGGSGDYYNPSGRLDILNTQTNSLQTTWEYSTGEYTEGITRLATVPDDSLLYIGTGIRDGYYTGDGKAEVFVYDGTNITQISSDDYFAGGVQSILVAELTIEVPVDIKPGYCPNPLNPKSQGVLPVAILGTEDFDVTTIDPATVSLEGVAPIRHDYEDVATPFDGELCDCHDLNGDGYPDLTLKFDTQELVETLGLEDFAGETIPLTLIGNLTEEEGGTPIEGQDCIRVLDSGKGFGKGGKR